MANWGFQVLNQGVGAIGDALAQNREKDRQQALLQQLLSGLQGTQNVPQGTPGAEFYSPDNSYRKQNDFSSPAVMNPLVQMLADPQMSGAAQQMMKMVQSTRPRYKQEMIPGLGYVNI
jgi:hypothetical protein